MTYLEAIEALADDLHVWRYRELTAEDHENPRVRDAWRERVVRMVTGEPEPPVMPAAVIVMSPTPPDPWLPLIRACDDYNPACCANPAPWCTRFNNSPGRDQCIACLQGQGITV